MGVLCEEIIYSSITKLRYHTDDSLVVTLDMEIVDFKIMWYLFVKVKIHLFPCVCEFILVIQYNDIVGRKCIEYYLIMSVIF